MTAHVTGTGTVAAAIAATRTSATWTRQPGPIQPYGWTRPDGPIQPDGPVQP
ncbi:hypothetical protein [Curtobacterium aetherium]|uniref:Uncharacterized protein n=1 Tax=Curtobacterium aetherium TaxID=2841594 RepID=A0ACD1E5X9_9MICO|nr:hypothetical protein [Curtobacterium sp. L6-1]QWS34211.1 hypothetical protein KM842_03205 [Curtobacterium sp. L6-1]